MKDRKLRAGDFSWESWMEKSHANLIHLYFNGKEQLSVAEELLWAQGLDILYFPYNNNISR